MIRDLYETDLPALADLEALCFSDPWSKKGLKGAFEDEYSLLLGYENQGVLAGYVNANCMFEECYIFRLCVHPDFRRRHIGEKLLRALIEFCEKEGIQTVLLEVRESNEPAKALYQKAGFLPEGRRENFYEKPTEAAIVMRRFLTEEVYDRHMDFGN